MKKIISLMLALLFIGNSAAFAAGGIPNSEARLKEEPFSSKAMYAGTSARSAVLYEINTGALLYEKNADEQRSVASLTKLMTLLLAYEAIETGRISKTDRVTASYATTQVDFSYVWISENEEMSVDELMCATSVASANNAAALLGEFIGGTDEEFVRMMNKRAAELGMNGTGYKNAHGLDEKDQYSTARDTATVALELLKKGETEYSSLSTATIREGEKLTNTNALLGEYEGITGLKTGTTDDAGYCFVACAERGDTYLLAVVLGCESSEARFEEAKKLLDYGFENYAAIKTDASGLPDAIKVCMGVEKTVGLKYVLPKYILVSADEVCEAEYTAELPRRLCAPLRSGETVGKLTVRCAEKEIFTSDIAVDSPVDRLTLKILLERLFAGR